MILTPASQPPMAPHMDDSTKSISALKESSSHNIPSAITSSVSANTKPKADAPSRKADEEDKFLQELNVPTVVLDTPSISHTMAAGLSLSLLGHTLFLKSQVPFPVAQLLRMPGGGSNPKVARKREELLATFDTLSSHLQTTFVALSTAYAKCKSAKSKTTPALSDENSQKEPQEDPSVTPQRGAAHLMFILGPSVGAARARILLTIDGLEVKVWGQRPDVPPNEVTEETEGDSSIDIEDTDEEEEETDSDSDQFEEDEDDLSEGGSVATEDQEDELDELDSDTDSVPPASRSPSPDPPARSLAPSPESRPSPQAPLKPLSDSGHNVASSSSCLHTSTPANAQPAPPSTSSSRESSPQPTLSYAEEQAALRAAERLLSRTLMNAWAEAGPGGDMASELAPTQTHVYLRAPRRFAHPAWVARQNLARTLDGVLDAFLVDAGAVRSPQGSGNAKKSRGVRTEGAWIGCRGGSAFATERAGRLAEDIHQDHGTGQCTDADEEDEEIWWAWDGKIIGFADW
ncbi:hypothetical protein FKP32DRAFT_1635003 [Trametes sanguinea]|nr:hypothetical protein FKP32DRAFT_1635003 [Trametes sanguinea]